MKKYDNHNPPPDPTAEDYSMAPFIEELAADRRRLKSKLKVERRKNENIKLNDPIEFDKRFNSYLPEAETYQQAYQRTEADFEAVFGHTKYSNYDSYRRAKRRRQKNETLSHTD